MPPRLPVPFSTVRQTLLIAAIVGVIAGCAHHIHVEPVPPGPSAITIPRTVQIVAASLSIIGADHMPGIALLKWPKRDLGDALVRYAEARGTFQAVSKESGDLVMVVATELAMRSRDRYLYRIRLKAEMQEGGTLIKAYEAAHEAEGSTVRWVTASDLDPIQAALQQALNELFAQIEADSALYEPGAKRPPPAPQEKPF